MRCYAKINLDRIVENIKKVSDKISKEKIIAVVKANAYGHGDVEVVGKLREFGIKNYAVATLSEALKISNIYKDIDILILGEIDKENFKSIENTNILISISRFSDLEYIYANNLKNRIHLKLDTGMNRLGFRLNEIDNLEKYIDLLNIEAIFTHLSSVDSDLEYTQKQIDLFLSSTKNLKIKKHILNSAGIRKFIGKKEYVLDYVRMGIDLYKNAMGLYTKVVHVHDVKKGDKIGYDGTYIAEKDLIVATLSIGYADGFKRVLSNKVEVTINNIKYSQIGNICMDLMMIKVDKKVRIGDEVLLFNSELELQNIAKLANTITYEILTSISDRVKRVYN